jgi:hypothetical protein
MKLCEKSALAQQYRSSPALSRSSDAQAWLPSFFGQINSVVGILQAQGKIVFEPQPT